MLQNLFQKQLIMRRVLYSLAPIFLFSVYLYGWRVVALLAVNLVLGILTEYIVERTRKKKVSEAVFVTCTLYTLALPPLVPFWISGVGIVFAVLLGKEVYGGFGRNVFNPAITGRLFIYISFPTVMTQAWKVPGAFGTNPDVVTSATPLALMREGELPDLVSLLTGMRLGSIGEGMIILIVLAGVYLAVTKTANWRLMASTVLGAALFAVILYLAGVPQAFEPLRSMLAGSILFVAVFMATDPVSAPKKPVAMWIYGAMIGIVAMIVRYFSLFPEGTSFGIIIGNTFAPLLDELVGRAAQRKKVAA